MVKNPQEKIGRVCSIDKIRALFQGLSISIGGVALRKELTEIIAEEKDQDVRFLLYSLILKDAPPETKDAVESTMKMAAQTIQDK